MNSFGRATDSNVLPLPWNRTYKSAWQFFLTTLQARYGANPLSVSIAVAGPAAKPVGPVPSGVGFCRLVAPPGRQRWRSGPQVAPSTVLAAAPLSALVTLAITGTKGASGLLNSSPACNTTSRAAYALFPLASTPEPNGVMVTTCDRVGSRLGEFFPRVAGVY